MTIRERLEETHGARFELLRHFLPRFFDSDLISSQSDWTRAAAGVIAILVSSWILLAYLLLVKYGKLRDLQLFDRIPLEVRADLWSLTGMSICAALVLVAVLWQSLYPSLRDYLSLAALPVSASDIFVGKFTAVLVTFVAFNAVLILPCAMIYATFTQASILTALATMGAASSFAFFSSIALQGALLNVLPARLFERAMIWLQALLGAAGLGGFPFTAWKGPQIFSGLNLSGLELTLIAIVPLFSAIAVYSLSFHRYRKLLLEAPRIAPPRRMDLVSRLLDLLIKDPREQAALGFMWTTITRNRTQRLAILVYAGLAAAWVIMSFIDSAVAQPGRYSVRHAPSTAIPLALIAFTMLGLRHLFSLPADLRANWIFQITERDGRMAWMRAVERFVLGCGVTPVVVTGATFIFRTEGWLVAAGWTTLAFGAAAVAFERLFKGWRKLPFTCGYLPGKRPLVMSLALFASAMAMLVPISQLVYYLSTNPASFIVTFGLELALWSWLRRSRMKTWGIRPLLYQDQLEPEVETFGLADDGTTLAQEEFQREWSRYLRTDDIDPILRPSEDGEGLTQRVWRWLRTLPNDLKFAGRLLAKKPGFAASVILTLGLGLGLNGAFFTIFNALLLRPLAVRDPASVVSIAFETAFHTPVHLSWQEYQLVSATPGLPEFGASSLEGTGLDGHPAKLGIVSSNYFSLLGAGIAIGRPFEVSESQRVLVLSYRTWQSRYASDEKILGKQVSVQGVPFTVIGVAAPEFAGLNIGTIAMIPPEVAKFGIVMPDLWVPVEVWNRTAGLPQYPMYGLIARLPANTTVEQFRQRISSLGRRYTDASPQYNRIARAEVETLDIPVTWTALRFSLPLLIAFGLTMIIPCANAANMMLARAMSRQREIGTRISLGAGRGRIVRQLLAESFLFAAIAGGLGLVIARIALNLFTHSLYATASPTILFRVRIPDFVIDGHVFGYMLIVAALTTILFGLAPAAQATRVSAAFALRGEVGLLRPGRMRDALVIVQVSACVMLLAIAGILVRGGTRSIELNRGYEFAGVLGVASISPEDTGALIATLEKESWWESRAFMAGTPSQMNTVLAGSSTRATRENLYYLGASSDFFSLVRLPLLRGRSFTQLESELRAPVAVISSLTAQKLWPNEDPLGKTLVLESGSDISVRLPQFREATIIGVAHDIVAKARDGGPRPTVYFPDTLRRGTMMVIRGKGTSEQTARQLETALAQTRGAANGARVVALQEVIDWEMYPQRAASWLASILGVVAFLLTMTGIYGVMSYAVNQRTKELGIRMALGATPAAIGKLVLSYSGRMTAVGLFLGMVLALGVLQYCASIVDLAIDTYDIPAYLASLAAVSVATLLAAVAPIQRACAIGPQEAVRAD